MQGKCICWASNLFYLILLSLFIFYFILPAFLFSYNKYCVAPENIHAPPPPSTHLSQTVFWFRPLSLWRFHSYQFIGNTCIQCMCVYAWYTSHVCMIEDRGYILLFQPHYFTLNMALTSSKAHGYSGHYEHIFQVFSCCFLFYLSSP